MRITPMTHWALASAPLLAILGVIFFSFSSEVEVALFFADHAAAHPGTAFWFKVLTDWSNPVFYVTYAVMLLTAIRSHNHERKRFVIVLIVMQVLIGLVTVNILKHMIGRPRPGQGWYFDPMTTRGTYHSLPSGHTTEIFGWSLPLTFRLNRIWFTLLIGLFTGAVGFSRIYLNWHHPSDVFFGWLLGSFTAYAAWTVAGSSLFRKKGF